MNLNQVHTTINMPMSKEERLIRLLHLFSPTLPTGTFSYSQGLEWAVEAGWVHDDSTLKKWISEIMSQSIAFVDIPIMNLMMVAIRNNNQLKLTQLCDLLIACRETSELRDEERNRGRALAKLLRDLNVGEAGKIEKTIERCQLAGFALATVKWNININEAATGYTWAWLENIIIAGVKIIPLGQTAGQQLLLKISTIIPETVRKGLQVKEPEVGSSCQAQALACCLHEKQYSRLYRS